MTNEPDEPDYRSEHDARPKGKRDRSHPLRNVYQTGDESGTEPADPRIFEGLTEPKQEDY